MRSIVKSICWGLTALCFVGCDAEDDVTPADPNFAVVSCAQVTGPCVQVAGGDADGLQEQTQLVAENGTIVLGKGRFELANQVTIRDASGVSLVGQGIDVTVLSFAGQKVQKNRSLSISPH